MQRPVLTISRRVYLGFGLLALLGAGGAAFSVYQFMTVQGAVGYAAALSTNVQNLMETIGRLEVIRRAETHYQLDGDEASLAARQESEARFRDLMTEAMRITYSPQRRVMYGGIRDQLAPHDLSLERYLAAFKAAGAARDALFQGGDALTAATGQLVAAVRATHDVARGRGERVVGERRDGRHVARDVARTLHTVETQQDDRVAVLPEQVWRDGDTRPVGERQDDRIGARACQQRVEPRPETRAAVAAEMRDDGAPDQLLAPQLQTLTGGVVRFVDAPVHAVDHHHSIGRGLQQVLIAGLELAQARVVPVEARLRLDQTILCIHFHLDRDALRDDGLAGFSRGVGRRQGAF